MKHEHTHEYAMALLSADVFHSIHCAIYVISDWTWLSCVRGATHTFIVIEKYGRMIT